MPDTLSDWDLTRLVKFLQNYTRQNAIPLPVVGGMEELTILRKLTLADEMQFLRSTTSVGAAGGAAALPATPDSYIYVLDPMGEVRLIPLYKP